MKIHTKVVYSFVDDQLVLVEDEWVEYAGPVARCKGASAQQEEIADSQQKLMGTLQNDFGTAFQGQQGILNNLTKSLNATIASGPSQFGFSPGETTALNTAATTATATQYANARRAAGEAAAAAGGGNQFLPTGATAQNQANIAAAGAQQESDALTRIQQAGWQQGNQNYNNAVSGALSTAAQYNPTGFAGAANTSGAEAAGTAKTVADMNNAADPWNVIGGALGGIAGTALNFLPGASALTGATKTLFNAKNAGIGSPDTNVFATGTIPSVPMPTYPF